jgi:hypothetical protein
LIRDEDEDIVGGLSLTAYNTPSVAAHPPILYPILQSIAVPATAAGPGATVPPLYYHYAHH